MHETYDSEITARKKAGRIPSPIAPRLGIIGGGQLARMTALAALPLGCEVVVLENNPFSPAARISPGSRTGNWNRTQTLLRFAAGVDVITLENEFVGAGALAVLEKAGHKVFPSSTCLALTQDKLTQKNALRNAGLAVVKFREVNSPEEVAIAAREFGWPLLLKARRNGYDGKGNFTVRSKVEIAKGWQALGGGRDRLFVEAFCHFAKEIAVIVTRGRDGASVVYPVVETVQRNHICHVVKAPAHITDAIAARATELAQRAVEVVGGVGSFGVEMFLSANDDIIINELAPRVHNSGHYTIEACDCSQFENHVRAVLGWPLGSTRMVVPAAVMINLLGREKTPGRPGGLRGALQVPGAHVHLYGKMMSGAGRKMGHVTALGNSVAEALATAERSAKEIYFGANS